MVIFFIGKVSIFTFGKTIVCKCINTLQESRDVNINHPVEVLSYFHSVFNENILTHSYFLFHSFVEFTSVNNNFIVQVEFCIFCILP